MMMPHCDGAAFALAPLQFVITIFTLLSVYLLRKTPASPSPAFRELWSRHDVLNRPEGWKAIRHPLVGELTLDFFLLQPVASEHLRLLIYSPRSHSGTAEKIERLLAFEEER